MAIINKRICDICGKDGATPIRTLVYIDTPLSFLTKEVQFAEQTLDLCEDCLAKATNIHAINVSRKKYEIKPLKE